MWTFCIYSAILYKHETSAALRKDRGLLVLQKGACYLSPQQGAGVKPQSKTWTYQEEPGSKKKKKKKSGGG